MNIRQRQALTAVARGQAVADLYVRLLSHGVIHDLNTW